MARSQCLQPDLFDDLRRICSAPPAPLGELDGIDPPFTVFDLEDDRVRYFELDRQRPLCELSVDSELEEYFAEFFVLRFVLWPCSHIGSRVK